MHGQYWKLTLKSKVEDASSDELKVIQESVFIAAFPTPLIQSPFSRKAPHMQAGRRDLAFVLILQSPMISRSGMT